MKSETYARREFNEAAGRRATAAASSWPDGMGIIYFAMSGWKGMWKNRHQLMSRLARQLPVLYVEPPVRLKQLRSEGLLSKAVWSDFRKEPMSMEAPGLNVFHTSKWFPVSGSRYLSTLTRKRWTRAVNKAAKEAGISKAILWVSLPDHVHVVGEFDEALSIYHIVDEYAGYTGADAQWTRRLRLAEELLLDAVDFSIVVSPELLQSKRNDKRDIHVIENAVDAAAYERAVGRQEVPADLSAIAAPRLGYSGLIGKRLDLDLLANIASARPDWSLVLVGRVDRRDCQEEIESLEQLDNVHFLGEKDPHDVPAYVCGFQLGLLPYAINLETRNISPLKLYEYLAAGIPVVSTGIPSALRMKDYVEIADEATEFERAVAVCLESDKASDVSSRREEASRNTWDQRVAAIAGIIRRDLKLPAESA
jgi:glycosyltransferase involved in cell wall biosynthesis